MKKAVFTLLLFVIFGCCLATSNASTIFFPSMEVHLDSDWLDLGEEELTNTFGENIISMELDDQGKVTSCIVDGAPYFDFQSGIINQSGNMDAGFLGAFNLREAEGQGLVEHETLDPDEVKDFDTIPGMPDLPAAARQALRNVIK